MVDEDDKNRTISAPPPPPPPPRRDSNGLKRNDGSAAPSSSSLPKKTPSCNGNKIKSCSGWLYHSSSLQSHSRNPLCFGLTRSLPTACPSVIREMEAKASKSGMSLLEFKYACVGYSLYKDNKGHTSDGQRTRTELPLCEGLKVLVDQSGQTADSTSAPSHSPAQIPTADHTRNKEVGNGFPQRQSPKPSNSMGDEFVTRFIRNANVIANGVAKNVRRVGNRIKQSVDSMNSNQGRPK